MAIYKIFSENRKTFPVNEEEKTVASLNYSSWFVIDPDLVINEKTYPIRQKGRFGLTIELLDGTEPMYSFAMNWKGQIIINALDTVLQRDYVFKQKVSLRPHYKLSDKNGIELLDIEAHFKISSLKFEYTVNTTDAFEALPDKLILLGIQLHCINYYISVTPSIM